MNYTTDELREMQLNGNYLRLVFALSSTEDSVRVDAMTRLAKFQKDEVLVAALDSLKNDLCPEVRASACTVLRNFERHPRIEEALKSALHDDHRTVRGRATAALAQLRVRDALDNIIEMTNHGVEPDIADSVELAIDILSEPDKSDALVDLASNRDVEGIGKLFDCMLRPDHEEVERGLKVRGKRKMLRIFREWESSGRLTALDPDPQTYSRAREDFARRLIEAL